MNRIYVTLIIWIVLVVLFLPAHVFGKQFLVKEGHSDYVIVEASDAIPAEVTAAEELKTYLKQMTGADLEIIKEDKYVSGPMIAVGFNSKLPDALKAQTFGSLGEEELIIKSDKDTLLLAGGRPRGTLYAVYEFLHNQGVRWYTPAYTKVPSLPTLQLLKDNYRYNPPMRARSEVVGNATTEQWTVANRMNRLVLWGAPSAKYGGGYTQGPGEMHTFFKFIPIEVLKAHPEWMAVIDANGNRDGAAGPSWGLCLSNKEAREYLVKKSYEWAQANPDITEIYMAQNDGSRWCICDQCHAFYVAHGGQPSSLMVQLVNEFAEVLAADPNMKGRVVKMLAYSWAIAPPTNIKVSDNVMMLFCVPGDFLHPVRTDPGFAAVRQYLVGWKKVAKNFDVYLYEPFKDYWWIYPCIYPSADNIKWAYDNGVNNVYIAISGYGDTYGSQFVELEGWVYARKMWNPNVSTQELINDFANGYYGSAAKAVIKAISLTHKNVFDKNNKTIQYNNSAIVPNFINPATVRAVNKLFDTTYNNIKDSVYKSRLSFAWIPYLWSDFWLGYSEAGSYDPKTKTWMVPLADADIRNQYAAKVKRFMIEHKVNSYGEGSSLNPHELSLGKLGVAWPAKRIANDNVEAVVVPGVAGQIFDFKDTSLNFSPLKHYYGALILSYPMYSSWRDYVNMDYAKEYTVKKSEPNEVVLESRIGDFAVSKTVTMCDKTLQTSLVANANKESSAQLLVTSMFDLTAKVFGDYPTLYVEKTDGKWSKRVIGSDTIFWYQGGTIDISNTTGRMILAAQNRPEGVLMTFNPTEVLSVSFEYDRYDQWTAVDPEQGHMMVLSLTSSSVKLQVGQTIKMDYSLKILPDANLLVKLP